MGSFLFPTVNTIRYLNYYYKERKSRGNHEDFFRTYKKEEKEKKKKKKPQVVKDNYISLKDVDNLDEKGLEELSKAGGGLYRVDGQEKFTIFEYGGKKPYPPVKKRSKEEGNNYLPSPKCDDTFFSVDGTTPKSTTSEGNFAICQPDGSIKSSTKKKPIDSNNGDIIQSTSEPIASDLTLNPANHSDSFGY